VSLSEKKKDKMFNDRKKESKYADPRFAGKKVNKIRQQQRREYILNTMRKRANAKKNMGMALFPEEEWVLSNPTLFL
jgi:hypothetical protein